MDEINDLFSWMKHSMERYFMDNWNMPKLADYAGLVVSVVFLLAAVLLIFLVYKGVHAVRMFIKGSIPVRLNRTNPIKYHFLQDAGTVTVKRTYREKGEKFRYRRDYTKFDVEKEINKVFLDMSPLIITDDRWSEKFTSWYHEHGPVSRRKFPLAVSDFYIYMKENI